MTASKSPPIVAILAGGLGTRLRPLISDTPKSLALIGEEPFLFLLLKKLSSYGIKKVVLLTGYMHEEVVAACGDGSAFGLEIIYSVELSPLGTGGAVANAKAILQPYAEFILLNGDTYLKADLSDFIAQSVEPTLQAIIGVLKNTEYQRFGSVQINQDTHLIEAFREKDTQSTGFINAGIYKLSTKVLNIIPANIPSSLEKDIFPKIITTSSGKGLGAYILNGSLHDIGTPESYTEFNLERTHHES